MTIKIRLTEEEEQMILSQEEADNLKVERDHIHITRALSKIIEESELDAESFDRLKERYHFRQVRNRKIHIYRCSAKCIDVVYRLYPWDGEKEKLMLFNENVVDLNKFMTMKKSDSFEDILA